MKHTSKPSLVGGLEHDFHFSILIGNVIIPTFPNSFIFFRGKRKGPTWSNLQPCVSIPLVFSAGCLGEFLGDLQLVGGLEHFLFFHKLGTSSSQVTHIFQRARAQPPTRQHDEAAGGPRAAVRPGGVRHRGRHRRHRHRARGGTGTGWTAGAQGTLSAQALRKLVAQVTWLDRYV